MNAPRPGARRPRPCRISTACSCGWRSRAEAPAGRDLEVAQLDVAGAVPGADEHPPLGAAGVVARGGPGPAPRPPRDGARAPSVASPVAAGGRAGGRTLCSAGLVNVAQSVELLVVVQAVGGSSPLVHPWGGRIPAGVAEPVYALGLGPSGATHGGSSPLTRIMPVSAAGHPARGEPRPPRRRRPRRRGQEARRADAPPDRPGDPRPRLPARQGAGQRGHEPRRARHGHAGDAEGRHRRLVRRGPRAGRGRAHRRPGPRRPRAAGRR